MFIIKIVPTNMRVLEKLNGGVRPQPEYHDDGTPKVTYLVVAGGVPNRIIDHFEYMMLKKDNEMITTTRKFSVV